MMPFLYPIIAADPECQAALGGATNTRFYAYGEARQGVTTPYAVWQMISGVPENYLGRLPDMDGARVQIDVYSTSQESARTTAIAIRDALEPYGHMVGSSDRGIDDTTRNPGLMLEFEFFTPR